MNKTFKKFIASVVSASLLTSALSSPCFAFSQRTMYNNGFDFTRLAPVSSALVREGRSYGSLGFNSQLGSGWNWCCAFVSQCCLGIQCDSVNGSIYRSCSDLVESCIVGNNAIGTYHHVSDNIGWAQSKSSYVTKENFTPKPGDLVFFEEGDWNMSNQYESDVLYANNGPDHVGIVRSVDSNGITTIEGNYAAWNHAPANVDNYYYDIIMGYYNDVCVPGGIDYVAPGDRVVTRVTTNWGTWRANRICGYVRPYYALRGDVNGDGEVTIADLPTLRQYIMKDPISIHMKNADVNHDNKVDLTDMICLQYFMLNDEWPSNC